MLDCISLKVKAKEILKCTQPQTLVMKKLIIMQVPLLLQLDFGHQFKNILPWTQNWKLSNICLHHPQKSKISNHTVGEYWTWAVDYPPQNHKLAITFMLLSPLKTTEQVITLLLFPNKLKFGCHRIIGDWVSCFLSCSM